MGIKRWDLEIGINSVLCKIKKFITHQFLEQKILVTFKNIKEHNSIFSESIASFCTLEYIWTLLIIWCLAKNHYLGLLWTGSLCWQSSSKPGGSSTGSLTYYSVLISRLYFFWQSLSVVSKYKDKFKYININIKYINIFTYEEDVECLDFIKAKLATNLQLYRGI